jgi:hypothetical protein
MAEERDTGILDPTDFTEPDELFDYTDYVTSRPDVDPIDYVITSQHTAYSNAPEAEVDSNLAESFLHGLTLHNYGSAPENLFSTEGAAYLVGSFIPLVTINRMAVAHTPKLLAGLRNVIGGKPTGLTKALQSQQVEFGSRIALEAGVWTGLDAELEGVDGYKEALAYTALGEGLFLGIQQGIKSKLKLKNGVGVEEPGPTSVTGREILDDIFAGPVKNIDEKGVKDFYSMKARYDENLADEIQELVLESKRIQDAKLAQARSMYSNTMRYTSDELPNISLNVDDSVSVMTPEGVYKISKDDIKNWKANPVIKQPVAKKDLKVMRATQPDKKLKDVLTEEQANTIVEQLSNRANFLKPKDIKKFNPFYYYSKFGAKDTVTKKKQVRRVKRATKKQEAQKERGSITGDKLITYHATIRGLRGSANEKNFNEVLAQFLTGETKAVKAGKLQDFKRLEISRYLDKSTKERLAKVPDEFGVTTPDPILTQVGKGKRKTEVVRGLGPEPSRKELAAMEAASKREAADPLIQAWKAKNKVKVLDPAVDPLGGRQVARPRKSKLPTEDQAVKAAEILEEGRVEARQMNYDRYKSTYETDARAFMDTFNINNLVREKAEAAGLSMSKITKDVVRGKNLDVEIPAIDDLIAKNPKRLGTVKRVVLEAEEEYNKILAQHDTIVQQFDPYVTGRARLPEPEGALTEDMLPIELPDNVLRSPHDLFMQREMFAFKDYVHNVLKDTKAAGQKKPIVDVDPDTVTPKSDKLTFTERITGIKFARTVKPKQKTDIEDMMEQFQGKGNSYTFIMGKKKYAPYKEITLGKKKYHTVPVPKELQDTVEFMPTGVFKPVDMPMEAYVTQHKKYIRTVVLDNELSDPKLRRYIDSPEDVNKQQVEVTGDTTSVSLSEAKHADGYNNFMGQAMDIVNNAVPQATYKNLSPARKAQTIPLNKNMFVALDNALQDVFVRLGHGAYNKNVYMDILKKALKTRGIDLEKLPKGPISPQGKRAIQSTVNTIEENNILSGLGVAPGKKGSWVEYTKKQKILKDRLEVIDSVDNNLAAQEDALAKRLLAKLESLVENKKNFEFADEDMLIQLNKLANGLQAINQNVSFNTRRVLKMIAEDAKALAVDDTPFGQLTKQKKSKKSKAGIKGVDKGVDFETAAHQKITKALERLMNPKIESKLLNEVDLTNIKKLIDDPNAGTKHRAAIQNTLYRNILNEIDAWVYNSPRRAFKSEYEAIVKDVTNNKKSQQELLQFQKLFIADILANPDDFVKQAVELNKYGKSDHKLYLALRSMFGDDNARIKLHSLIGRQELTNNLTLQKYLRQLEDPDTTLPNKVDDAAEASAKKKDDGPDDPPSQDDGMPPGDGGNEVVETALGKVEERNTLADALINDPVNELRKIARKTGDYVFLELADKTKLSVQKLKRKLSNDPSIAGADEDSLYSVLRRDGRYSKVVEEIVEDVGSPQKFRELVIAPARSKADEIQKAVNEIQFDKSLDEAAGMAKATETVKAMLNAKLVPANVRKFLQSIYDTLDDLRRISNNKIREANVRRKELGLPLLKETRYLPGYLPVVHDGVFDVYIGGVLHGNFASKAEVREALLKFFKENPQSQKDIRIQPINSDLDAAADIKTADALIRDAEIGAQDAKKFLEESTADTYTDLLFRHARSRQEGLLETTQQTFDDLIQRYSYQAYKYGEYADVATAFKQAHDTLIKKGYNADANYIKAYQDYFLGRPDKVERGFDKLLKNSIANISKIPGVGSALAHFNITPGSSSFRKLSGMITSFGSFAALGFNVATSMLQLSIVGMNVVPILGFRSTIKGIRNARLAMKPGTEANKKYGKILQDLGLDMNTNDGRVQEIYENALKVANQSGTKVNLKRVKDASLYMFNNMDKLGRVITAIAAKEHGVNIAKRIAQKQSRYNFSTITDAREYLKREERILFEQYMRLGGPGKMSMTDDAVLDAFSRNLVDETNFVYNTSNVPFAFNNAVAAPLLQFKTWVQKETMFVMQSIFDAPKKLPLAQQYEEFIKITGAFTALGGIFSLPGGQELDLLMRTVFGVSPKAYFYEKDSPFMDILAGGVAMGAGISLEGRMGAGNVFTIVDTENIFGIYPTRLFKAVSAFKEGRVEKGINYLLPRAIQNLMQGTEIVQSGRLMSSYSGDLVFDYDEMDSNPLYAAALKIAGFESPAETRNRVLKYALYDKSRQTGNEVRLAKWRAFESMDDGDFAEAYAILAAYNISRKEAVELWRKSRFETEADRTTIGNTTRSDELLEDVQNYRNKFR